MNFFRYFILLSCFLVLGGCAETEFVTHVAKSAVPSSSPQSQGNFKVGNPYKIDGQWYRPQESYTHEETGISSWYGKKFHGRKTANGETFNRFELTAAHRTLQMPSLIRVTNLDNGKSLILRVNDRGPFAKGRILDVSEKAAELLDFKNAGTAKVRVQVLKKESQQIAEAAKRGMDTSGTEVVMNQRRGSHPALSGSKASEPVQVADIVPPAGVSGHNVEGRFYPDPVVKQMEVRPSTIYVQAGSFANKANADQLARDLESAHGDVRVMQANIGGKQYYRVRIPAQSVPAADRIMAAVVRAGNKNAIIVVD